MTHRRPGFPLLFAFGGIALLGNGLKAVVSSSVLVSEAQFASFLRIPVEHVAVLLEAIIAGMVVALAVCPLLLQRHSARSVAIAACALAAAAFATFALMDLSQPAPWLRTLTVFACFSVGSGALACLAPSAQALVLLWPDNSGRTTLTTLWTGAAPGGFLAAPQLAKFLLPAFGLAGYFLAFSALPLLMLVLLLWLAWAVPESAAPVVPTNAPSLPAPLLMRFVIVVIAFESWSTLGSVAGYAKSATIAALVVLLFLSYTFARLLRSSAAPPSSARGALWLLFALFVLEMPTTGFFEAAFLFQHPDNEALVANRSTLAASAQIAGTIVAGFLVHRWPARLRALLSGFAVVAFVGVASYIGYPGSTGESYFLITPMITGFGSSGVTVLVLLAVLPASRILPILVILPSLAIMLGTEFGLEILQLVFDAIGALGADPTVAFRALFVTQAVFALAVPLLLRLAQRHGLPDDTPVPAIRAAK